ncbi:MAG: dicarboxylate/amino acid:cation symporter [Candidatus Zixiibacteriota bacterium]
MTRSSGNLILIGMIVGAIVGMVGGYYLPGFFQSISFIGTMFLNSLKMVVVPLIVASMIVGVTNLGDIRKLGRTSAKTLAYYLVTTGFSVLIGIVLVNLIQPGVGVESFGAAVPDMISKAQDKTLRDVLIGLIPSNVLGAAASGKVLPLIVFSLLFGAVLSAIGEKGKPVIALFDGINTAMMKIVHLVIFLAPIGVMSLIGDIVAQKRDSLSELVSSLGLYTLAVIGGLLIHAIFVLPAILRLLSKRKPLKYFINMGEALATAFTTASSSATLPVTIEAVEERNKVDSRAASFVLPLGATINMDGTAMYEAVAAIFIAQVYGIDLSMGQQIIVFLTATLASIGAAGIPHAGTVMMVTVLAAVNLPMEGIGLIFAVDWFLDRCRTTVNVWGDSIGAAVIAETKEFRA